MLEFVTHLHHKKVYLVLAATLLLMTAVFALKTSKAQLVLFPSSNATSTPSTTGPSHEPDLSALLRSASSTPRGSEWTLTPKQVTPPRRQHSVVSTPTFSASLMAGADQLLFARAQNEDVGPVAAGDGLSDVERQLFLSPDRTRLAVTAWPCCGREGPPLTYIADLSGGALTSVRLGSFRSWSPDSRKVLVFRSNTNNARGREIYALGTDDSYTSLNLPIGVIDAEIAPDGRTAYVLTPNSTDYSDLWIRTPDGRDQLLLKGQNDIFVRLRWSPAGDKIAFLRSNMDARTPEEARQLWIVNADGTEPKKVAERVLWGYPPVWSPDGTKLLFAREERGGDASIALSEEVIESNIWEYDDAARSARKITDFSEARTLHPNYSEDGKTIFFVSDHTGPDEVWAISATGLRQLTNDRSPKRHPIVP